MRSFVFIAFALDCIEKKGGFLFSSMESGEEGNRVVGGNAATR